MLSNAPGARVMDVAEALDIHPGPDGHNIEVVCHEPEA